MEPSTDLLACGAAGSQPERLDAFAPFGQVDLYAFEEQRPPCLSGAALAAELRRRRERRLVALAALVSVLALACLLAATVLLAVRGSRLAVPGMVYLAASFAGAGMLAVVFARRKELLS